MRLRMPAGFARSRQSRRWQPISPSRSSAYQAGSFVVEFPAGDEELHGCGVVARCGSDACVEGVGLLDLLHVDLDAAAWFIRHCEFAVEDAEGVLRYALTVLPDPVGIDCCDFAGRGRGYVGEHGERNVEMIVGVRTPGQAPFFADLRDAHRTLH